MKSLVYILCPSYSGSTLLTLLLATHRDIATIGELKATHLGNVTEYSCSCGVPILACPFWEEVGRAMKSRGQMFSPTAFDTHFRAESGFTNIILRAGLRGPLFEALRQVAVRTLPAVRQRLSELLTRNLAMIDSICEITGGHVFLDGSKDAIRLQYLRRSGLPRVQVLYLLRDGRGASFSYMRHYNVSMNEAAREWVRAQHECERAMATLSESTCFRVCYEDLCREPDGTMEAIYRFLELDPQLGSLAYRAPDHHIIGNSMRLRSVQSIRLDEGWREGLSPADLAAFEEIAGKLNRSYGYGKQ
jgi:hypothetical protein